MKTASLVLCLVASAAALQQRTGAVPVGRAAAKVAAKAPASAGSIANGGAAAPAAVAKSGGVDVSLIAYFFFWYLGNYYYNITNKLALKAAGGSKGFPMTIASLQLGIGVIYALFAWARARSNICLEKSRREKSRPKLGSVHSNSSVTQPNRSLPTCARRRRSPSTTRSR